MSRKVTIIGAGPGGLASAMLLAKSGAQVTVLERGDRVGGRTRAIEQDGFRFDTGPTFFLYPRVLGEIFAACGSDLRREVPMTRLDPQYRLHYGDGGTLDATADIARMEQAITALSPQDAGGFRRFLDASRQKLAAFRPVLERPFLGLADVFAPDLLKALPQLGPLRSVYDDIGRFFKDERIRLAFTFQAKYLGMSPFRCPSLFSILSFLEYEYGVWHPTGGCAAVMEGMARVARSLGVDIRLNAEVTALEFRGRRAVAANTADGTRHGCDALVINADFSDAMRRLVPNALRRRWSDRKLAKARFSCSTFMLYLGVRGDVALPHHTIHIPAGYRANLGDIEAGRLTPEPCFYIQNAGATDPTLAPEGHRGLYCLVPVPNLAAPIDWRQEGPRMRGKLLRQMERVHGIADLQRRIVSERMITPLDWRDEHRVHLGATFNLAHGFSQMLHLRPRNRFEDLDGVYLTGGGTHPGSGLPVIFESARISSRLLAADLGLAVDKVPKPVSEPALEAVA